MKKTVGIVMFLGLLALIVQAGCSTTPKSSDASYGRGPASTTTYPLNPRFEQKAANEDESIARVRDGILYVQNKYGAEQGHYMRGTHSKGTCMMGELEIFDVKASMPTVAPRIAKGMFSVPGRYKAQVRFANGASKVNPDQTPDVRAVSLSVSMPQEISNPQGLMDFAMNDATTFPINDAQVFADVLTIDQFGKAEGFKRLGFWRFKAAGEAALVHGAAQQKPAKLPYQRIRYYSTVPFALGDDEAVKYSLKPCDSNRASALNLGPNELSEEIIRHVNSDPKMSCWEFQVQLLEPNKMTNNGETMPNSFWVENALSEWPESQAPFYTVGRMTLTPKSIVDQNSCERWHIDVNGNNNVTHHGLGSINRARSTAEAASAAARLRN